MDKPKSKLNLPAGSPLQSWDVFMEGYNRLMTLADDLNWIKLFAKRQDWVSDWNYREELLIKNKTIIITDTKQIIVFTSSNMLQMSGYTPAELQGWTPRKLQGPETETKTRAIIREMIRTATPFEEKLVNYKKTGETYICHIKAFPVYNSHSEVAHFIAFEEAA